MGRCVARSTEKVTSLPAPRIPDWLRVCTAVETALFNARSAGDTPVRDAGPDIDPGAAAVTVDVLSITTAL